MIFAILMEKDYILYIPKYLLPHGFRIHTGR